MWLSILAIVVAGVAVYSNHFENPFVFDDRISIEESYNVRQLPDVVTAMGAPDGSCASGRPLVALSLAVNFTLAKAISGNGLDVTGYHVFNLLTHLASAVCLLILARAVLARFFAARVASLLALAIAALWVVHPLHTAAINHVSYRNETLVAFFYLLTLLGAARALSGECSGRWITLSALSCALGMACKEVMVSAPLIVLFWDRAVHSGSFREALGRHWKLHLSLAATWGVLVWSLVGSDRGEFVGFGAQGITGWSWLLTQSEVLLYYLRLVLWPHPLVIDASDWPIAVGLGEVWPSALAILLLFGASVWATWRRAPLGVVALGVFAVLAPTSSFIPITGAPVAEHRLVLPLAGLLTLIVIGTYRLLGRVPAPARGALVALVVVALGLVTFQRNADFRTLSGIWQDVIDKRPRNTRAYEHLCDQHKAAGRFDLAEAAYRKSLSIDPDQAKTSYNLGLILAASNRMGEAKRLFAKGLELDPGMTEEAFLTGWSAVLMGRIPGGVNNMRSALSISPELIEEPNFIAPCLRLAEITAVAMEPELYDPTYAEELGRRLVTSLGQATEPKELAARARAHDTRASALANLGRKEEALAAVAEAIADARAAGRPKLVRQIQGRMQAIQKGGRPRIPVLQKPQRP